MGTRSQAVRGAVVVLVVLLWTGSAAAKIGAPRFGLGIILGEPTGLTGKVFLHENHALDFIAAYDITDEGFVGTIDYHFLFDPWPFRLSAAEMPLYVGIGGKVAVFGEGERKHHEHEDVGVGIRIPIGLTFLFNRVPIEVFLEIAPGIRVFPATDADVDGGVGARFYF